MDTLEVRVRELIDAGLTDLDCDLALFAIRSYARRNFIAHGRTYDLDQSEQLAGLASCVDSDDKLLVDILPDEEKPMVGKWRRVLAFYRSTHIRQNGDGEWERPPALSVAPESPPPSTGRLGRAVLRSQIEMGERRGSSSPDGPPPTNVTFDTGLSRYRSDPGKRSISKRPAMGQPPGQPSLKKAKGLFYVKSEAIAEDIEDSDAWDVENLQLRLHSFAAKLAQASPSAALKVLRPQLKQLESSHVRVKARLEKKKKQIDKNTRPKGPKA